MTILSPLNIKIKYFNNITLLFTLIVMLITVNSSAQTNDSIVTLYYPFENDLADSSGNENHGGFDAWSTDTDVITDIGYLGKCMVNKSNDYVVINAGSEINASTQSFTFTCWINPNTPNDFAIFSVIDIGYSINGWMIRNNDNNGNTLSFNFNGIEIEGKTLIPANSWTHVALVYDYDYNTINTYINGNSESSQILTVKLPYNGDLIVGRRIENSTILTGAIDEVGLCSRALPANYIDTVKLKGVLSVNDMCNSINVSTTNNNGKLTVNIKGATFKWIDCSNNQYIKGETAVNYTPNSIGQYSVEITKSSCIDTSACINITTVNINHYDSEAKFKLYPNPTSSQLSIDTELNIHEVSIIDITGKIIMITTENTNSIIVTDLSDGIYFIQLITDEGIINKKFVKQ